MKIVKALAFALVAGVAAQALAMPVNVNKADAPTIQKELKGIGAKTAAGIVAERSKGAFKDEADLKKRVKGVGDKTVEKNKGSLKFSD